MKPLLCVLGRHKFKDTDGKGITGEHKCEHCEKVIPAIEWPDGPPEEMEVNEDDVIDVEFEEVDNGTK